MAISGNLRTMPFPDLMQWISMSRKTGTLVIKGRRYTKKILFHDGRIAAVTSNNPREHLGYFLVGWGYLTTDELKQTLEQQREAKVMLGELLVRLGRMSREDVDRLVLAKTEQLVFDLMMWDEGEFFFLDETQPRREFQELNLAVDHFLFEGARQADERRRMAAILPDATWIPTLLTAVDEGQLDEGGRAVLGRIDGVRCIDEVALACRLPQFAVLAFVYQGVKNGVFSVRAQATTQPPPATAVAFTWRDLAREAENAVSLGDLLEAYRHVKAMRERFAREDEAEEAAGVLERTIERELNTTQLGPTVIPELAIPTDELTRLNCGPEEAFVLSRINGQYTIPQVLKQLPGPALYNLLLIHSFIQRGVIKLRESQAVARYPQPGGRY